MCRIYGLDCVCICADNAEYLRGVYLVFAGQLPYPSIGPQETQGDPSQAQGGRDSRSFSYIRVTNLLEKVKFP